MPEQKRPEVNQEAGGGNVKRRKDARTRGEGDGVVIPLQPQM